MAEWILYRPRARGRNATYKCSNCGKLCSSYYNDVGLWKCCPHCMTAIEHKSQDETEENICELCAKSGICDRQKNEEVLRAEKELGLKCKYFKKIQIVRCKDCRFYEKVKMFDVNAMDCNHPFGCQGVCENDYCCYGERRDT